MATEDENIVVGFSETKGRGLYAKRKFRQGETICGLPLTTLTNPDMYSLEAWPGTHLDCRDHPIGSTNHSCEPNAAVRGGGLVAWACINPGDEIVIDYKRTESKLAAPFNCMCGAKNCRGRIE